MLEEPFYAGASIEATRTSFLFTNSWIPMLESSGYGRELSSMGIQFLVHELLDSHAGELAPVARVFDAAERQVRRRPGRVIDEYHARVDAARHAFAARNILGED